MKYLLFILWMAATLALVASIIGMLLFIKDGYNKLPSTWMTIGLELLENLRIK